MAKEIKSVQILVKDTIEDPASPDTTLQVFYEVVDSVDAELKKSKGKIISFDVEDSVQDVWDAVIAEIKTDEGITP